MKGTLFSSPWIDEVDGEGDTVGGTRWHQYGILLQLKSLIENNPKNDFV